MVSRLLTRLSRVGRAPHKYTYPLERTQQRTYAANFKGQIYIWDIDKTYLQTEIQNLRGLLAVPFEFAVDKRNVAGTTALLRALRRGDAGFGLSRLNPIYFVSASPKELRTVIERKMLLDGVEFDGITFKDQLALIRHAQFGKVREQIGYKIAALFLNRRELPWDGVDETLFGDDSESDALIYSIYADAVAGRLRGDRLAATLVKNGVHREDAEYATSLVEDMPTREIVSGIYINLEVRRNPDRFTAFSGRVVPCHDAFQAALRLYEDGHLTTTGVAEVAEQLVVTFARRPPSLLRSAADLVSRGALGLDAVARLWPDLQARGLAPDYFVVDPARLPQHPRPIVDRADWVTPVALRG